VLDDDRRRRIARNEERFREINEGLQRDVADLCEADETVAFVCECALVKCREAIELSCAEYERVRADGAHFAVVPGHVVPEVERVVADGGHYHVIEKLGTGSDHARATDPRA
jgi:hypothetical protein